MLETKLFWSILRALSSIIELFVCKKVFDYSSERRRSNLSIYITMIIYVAIVIFLIEINFYINLRVLIVIILGFALHMANYRTSIIKSIMVNIVYWMIFLFADGLVITVSMWVNALNDLNALINNPIYRINTMILSKSMLFILLYLYKSIKSEIEIKKKEGLYLIVPIASNLVTLLYIFRYLFDYIDSGLLNISEIIYIFVLLFLSNISIIMVIRKIKKDSVILNQREIVQKNLEIQHRYYLKIKENQDRARQLHHDMKNHMIYIRILNENGHSNESYIQSIERNIKEYEGVFDTGNVLLDIILNDKKEVCDRQSIEFISSINFTKCDFIKSEDLSSIFSNILDNAIEACSKVEANDRFIHLNGKVREKFFILKVENSKVNEINIKNNKFISDKNDTYYHGIGISNIKKSVNKYDGETIIEHNKNRFIIKILIPIIE